VKTVKTLFSIAAAAILVVLALSCGPEAPPPPDPGVENAELGVRLTAVPDTLVVAQNQGPDLELKPADETVPGRMWFTAGPEVEGVNLVAAVSEHQQQIEAHPDGEYKGAQELTGPFGSAFYSRGRFLEGADIEEETAVFLIHPSGTRMLTISYRYPAADDSATRVEELIGVLGYLEF
jgi:hypothetical protein